MIKNDSKNSTLGDFGAIQHLKDSIVLIFQQENKVDKTFLIPRAEYTSNKHEIWKEANKITISKGDEYKDSELPEYFKEALDKLEIDYAEPVQTQKYQIKNNKDE